MFMVINKSKVVSYAIVFSTVVILFVMSVAMQKNNVTNEMNNTIETSAGTNK